MIRSNSQLLVPVAERGQHKPNQFHWLQCSCTTLRQLRGSWAMAIVAFSSTSPSQQGVKQATCILILICIFTLILPLHARSRDKAPAVNIGMRWVSGQNRSPKTRGFKSPPRLAAGTWGWCHSSSQGKDRACPSSCTASPTRILLPSEASGTSMERVRNEGAEVINADT